jgi:hypothetical protein
LRSKLLINLLIILINSKNRRTAFVSSLSLMIYFGIWYIIFIFIFKFICTSNFLSTLFRINLFHLYFLRRCCSSWSLRPDHIIFIWCIWVAWPYLQISSWWCIHLFNGSFLLLEHLLNTLCYLLFNYLSYSFSYIAKIISSRGCVMLWTFTIDIFW